MSGSKSTEKYKLTLSLDRDFARRFAAFSGFTGEDMSEIATRAIKRELKGFQVRRTEVRSDQTDEDEGNSLRLSVRSEDREAS